METIRRGLIGSLTDFVRDAGFGMDALEIVVDLVYQLAAYREEDIQQFPSVYLFPSEKNSDPLAMIAPGTERLPLRSTPLEGEFASDMLKDCAALATQGWSVFVEFSATQGEYGLFRSEQLPISVSSAETLSDPDSPSGTALLIRNCSKNCVELIAGNGQSMEFALTSAKQTSTSVADSIGRLAEQAVREIEEPLKAGLRPYLVRTLSSICQQCHGTIIAVVSTETGQLPSSLRDGVILDPPLDLTEAFRQLQADRSASSLALLQARETLLRGMVQSDGITILGSDGTVRAFRVFVKPNSTEQRNLDKIKIRGGARSRAYHLLKLRLGKELACVLFRSQDGKMECMGKS